ncbi:hypothetical protein ASG90_01155 [Nocardioides sp. Soil797]|nr:hypothetical protein ASG90_01155 [Nocardioides sp. Soil797]
MWCSAKADAPTRTIAKTIELSQAYGEILSDLVEHVLLGAAPRIGLTLRGVEHAECFVADQQGDGEGGLDAFVVDQPLHHRDPAGVVSVVAAHVRLAFGGHSPTDALTDLQLPRRRHLHRPHAAVRRHDQVVALDQPCPGDCATQLVDHVVDRDLHRLGGVVGGKQSAQVGGVIVIAI